MEKSDKKIRTIDAETIRLALSWVRDDITLAEVTRQLQTVNMTHSYTTLARALKEYLKSL